MTDQPDPLKKPKRFYKTADVAPADGGFAVRLDGRTPRSPMARPLVLPTQALAGLLAAEWAAQGDEIRQEQMPATRLAHTALDGVAAAREATAQTVADYLETDLICYFADHPASLVARQAAEWGPLLDWAHEDLGLTLDRASGIVHQAQPPRSLARARALALELDDFALAGLAFGVGLFGSAVLAFAVARRRLGGAEAFALSRLDEDFQEGRWGVDAEAAARARRLESDALMLERWFAALT